MSLLSMKRIALLFASLLLCLAGTAEAQSGRAGTGGEWAVVNTSSCFLRLKPDYESPLESQCLMGTVLKVNASDRYWLRVDAPDYKGCWTNALALVRMDEAQKDAYIAAPKMICTAEHTRLYAAPASDAERICDFIMGDIVRASSGGRAGWTEVLLADGRKAWVPESDIMPLSEWEASRSATEESLVRFAKTLLGTPYMWGGNTIKHFDCSGFTKFVYMMNGIVLPRNAREQIRCGVGIPFDFSRMRPGDLVFFGRLGPDGAPASVTHVAMYIGGGRILHSSQLVRINSLRDGLPDSYGRTPIAVRRILGHSGGLGAVWYH